jgi:hypothetical protein
MWSPKMPLLDFPPDMYLLRPGEAPLYGTFPELKRGVQWFISLLREGEWPIRRDAIAKRFYRSLIGEFLDPTGKGRYFDERDIFGWYLFLGEAFTDHPWNYEVFFGCHVIPILGAIVATSKYCSRWRGSPTVPKRWQPSRGANPTPDSLKFSSPPRMRARVGESGSPRSRKAWSGATISTPRRVTVGTRSNANAWRAASTSRRSDLVCGSFGWFHA